MAVEGSVGLTPYLHYDKIIFRIYPYLFNNNHRNVWFNEYYTCIGSCDGDIDGNLIRNSHPPPPKFEWHFFLLISIFQSGS